MKVSCETDCHALDTPFLFESRSEIETEELGRAVASLLAPGTVLALRGELATGKTCFVRGMGRFLAPSQPVHSPSFTLVNEYRDVRTDRAVPVLVHIDLYRLSGPAEVVDLAWEEFFDSNAVCAIEWAERAEPLLPAARLDVVFEHGGGDTRLIRILNRGLLGTDWQTRLAETLSKAGRRSDPA